MPHCGIQLRDSTSWKPATPSWNCCRIVSEIANVASDVKRPIPLIAFTALFGMNARSTATATGSQMIQLKTFVICSQFAVRCAADRRAALRTANRERRTPSCKYPYENDHSQEEHQRVVANVAGLEEAHEIAEERHDVSDERQAAVDERVDAAPQKLGKPLERPNNDGAVKLVDVPLVLHAVRHRRRSAGE